MDRRGFLTSVGVLGGAAPVTGVQGLTSLLQRSVPASSGIVDIAANFLRVRELHVQWDTLVLENRGNEDLSALEGRQQLFITADAYRLQYQRGDQMWTELCVGSQLMKGVHRVSDRQTIKPVRSRAMPHGRSPRKFLHLFLPTVDPQRPVQTAAGGAVSQHGWHLTLSANQPVVTSARRFRRAGVLKLEREYVSHMLFNGVYFPTQIIERRFTPEGVLGLTLSMSVAPLSVNEPLPSATFTWSQP